MLALGIALLSAEHQAPDLVRYAVRAEEAGFTFAPPSARAEAGEPLAGVGSRS